jgi:hypothetical protein
MSYYNQNPPAVNVNVSAPPPGQAGTQTNPSIYHYFYC